MSTGKLKIYDVYLCKTEMARHPGKFHTSWKAIQIDGNGSALEPKPANARLSLGSFLARGKGDSILMAKGEPVKP